ncbi:MAG: restriction endonuclease [Methylococcales bacterium]|nr:restriction endonuclease [Methylococcales bacterium]
MENTNTLTAFTSSALSIEKPGKNCIFCGTPLETHNTEIIPSPRYTNDASYKSWTQMICNICGWWTLNYLALNDDPSDNGLLSFSHALAIQQRFNIDSIEAPVKEIRRYLAERFESRFDIHPRKLEELVADIFKDHAHKIELTSYSKDGGVDLYLLYSENSEPVAVQVKRNKRTRKIGVKEIDTFLGTLVRNCVHKGIFITTSDYTKGAKTAASALKLKEQSYFLELWKPENLFDALKLNCQFHTRSADIAWNLRNLMPIEDEKSGDWYGGENWPVQERSIAHIEWWISQVSHYCKACLPIPTPSEILPKAASRSQVLEWLAQYCDDELCEVWSLAKEPIYLYCQYGKIGCIKKGTRLIVSGAERHEDFTKEDRWYVYAGYSGRGGEIHIESVIKIAPRSFSARDFVNSVTR